MTGFFPEEQETITGSTITPDTPALFPEDLETVTGGAISETVSGSAIRYCTYDNFNHLTSYQSGDTFAFYTYDAEDYRTTKQVMDSDGEKFTRYFYEGNHVVLEADESGRITAHNTYSINLTYCANNPLRYTDPDGHFFDALFRFIGGAVIGGGLEYLTQKYIEKRDKIDVKAILYEGTVGGVGAVIGGVGGTVKKAKTLKQVATSALKTGAKEAAGGFVENVSRQILVEGKPFKEVDWGEAKKTAAIAGVSGMAGDLADFPKAQLNAKNKTSISQITSLMDDAADVAPSPRTKALLDVDVTPSHKTVKNAADGLADASVSTGNVGRKSNATTVLSKDKLKNAKKSSPSLSKNQQKMQSQTVGSTLSGNTDLVLKSNKSGSNADLGNKLDYLFGKASGDKHNIERSKAMQAELQRIGIHNTPSGKEYISNHLNDVLKDPTNISNVEIRSYTIKELPDKPVVKYTATTRESLLMGPGGAVMVKSIWNGNRLLTVIVEGGKRK